LEGSHHVELTRSDSEALVVDAIMPRLLDELYVASGKDTKLMMAHVFEYIHDKLTQLPNPSDISDLSDEEEEDEEDEEEDDLKLSDDDEPLPAPLSFDTITIGKTMAKRLSARGGGCEAGSVVIIHEKKKANAKAYMMIQSEDFDPEDQERVFKETPISIKLPTSQWVAIDEDTAADYDQA
jgi:hypothetical protein